MRNQIIFHYDGSIAADHKISLRTLATTLHHLQSAIDRSYIDLAYGGVRKHARLRNLDYPLTDFVVGAPAEGGYILDLLNTGRHAIVDRIYTAISRAYRVATDEALPVTQSLVEQATTRRDHLFARAQHPIDRDQLRQNYAADRQDVRYADRSITKEIDQVLTQLRLDRYQDSTLELSLVGDRANPPLQFDSQLAQTFHRVVSTKSLGNPVRLEIRVRAMDRGNSRNMVGKGTHTDTGKDFTLHFRSPEDFNTLAHFMRAGADQPIVRIIAVPVIEYGTFDAEAGDMFFLALDQ